MPIASGISAADFIRAFDEMIADRMKSIDVDKVLIYVVDTVDEDALPVLAEQFDVLGYKGYFLADTDTKKRELIKKAIELHRYKGTPWSIKEALRTIGYGGATIQERLTNTIKYDGQHKYNGAYLYGPRHWATFRVVIDLGNSAGLTAQSQSDAVALINVYKNVRSQLIEVSFAANLSEFFPKSLEIFTQSAGISERTLYRKKYDGSLSYNGSSIYATYVEQVTINIT